MAFNYFIEKQKFIREWETKEKQYRDEGMSEENIQEMYKFDWRYFCSCRRYITHTQNFPSEMISDDDSTTEITVLFRKYKSLSVDQCVLFEDERYGWLEDIEDEDLLIRLKKLSEDDLELLTLIVFEEYSQSKIAENRGCSQKAISKKYAKIKNFLKNGSKK